MLMKVWITSDVFPNVTDETKALADEAGATVILHGPMVANCEFIPNGTYGYYEYVIEEVVPETPLPKTTDQVLAELVTIVATAATVEEMQSAASGLL